MILGENHNSPRWPTANACEAGRSPICSFSARAVLSTLATCYAACAQPSLPYLHTQPATDLRPASATLNGMVVPNNPATVAWFEWSERGGLTQTTSPESIGAGTTVVRVRAVVADLVTGRTYQCRVAASNALGVVHGAVQAFTTGNRVAVWGDNRSGQTTVPMGLSNVVAAAGGRTHSLALKADGTLAAWGANNFGQRNVPLGLSNVVAVTAGRYHSLALKTDGTLAAWGRNNFGQTNVPGGLSNVVAVAAGDNYCLALTAGGTVAAWGYNSYGQTEVPAGLSNVVAVAAGTEHSLALKADGTMAAWGYGGYGQTVVPAGLSNVVAVAGGGYHSLALKADGTVAAWGHNVFGQTTVPGGLSNVVAVAAGELHSLALKADGTLAAWGNDDSEQTRAPVGLRNVVVVAGGYSHSLAVGNNAPPRAHVHMVTGLPNADLVVALTGSDANGDSVNLRIVSLPEAGSLFQYAAGVRGPAITSPNTAVNDAQGRVIFTPVTNAFGIPYTSFGFLANDGEFDSAPALVTVNLRGWPDVHTQAATDIRPASATLNGMAVPNNLATVAWFEWGERGSFTQASSPTNTGAGSAVVRVSAAITTLLAGRTYQFRVAASNAAGVVYGAVQLFTTGTRVTAWGYNKYGQTTLPTGLSNVVAVTGGGDHSLALKADGTVAVWGSYYNGSQYVPMFVPAGLNNVVAVAGRGSHNLALKADGTVAAWGNNGLGQAVVPVGLNNVVAVAAGGVHNLALKADGTVAAWGYNGSGQTTVPPGLSNVVAVAGGGYHSLALKADGNMVAWGNNISGQATVPTGLSNVVAVAGGSEYSLALTADGTVAAWGYPFGAVNVPAGLSNVVAVATGGDHNLALKADGTVVAWGDNCCGQATVPAGLRDVAAVATGALHSLAVGRRAPLITSFDRDTNGAFHMTIQGYPEIAYSVWGSTNLVTWEFLGRPAQGSPGVLQFLDSSAMNLAQRFYRVSTP